MSNEKVFYDDLAPLYKKKAFEQLGMQKTLLKPFIDDCKTVLDVGCGVGIVSLALPHINVVGVDKSSEMIRVAQELSPNGTFHCADWHEYKPQSVDLVIAQAFLHLMNNAEASEYLTKMLSVAKRRCFVTTTLHDEEWVGYLPKEGAEHMLRFRVKHTEKSWLRLMHSATKATPFIVYKEKDLQGREWLCTLFFDDLPRQLLKQVYEKTG